MKAKDVMSSPVIGTRPESTVGEVAALLYERQISALPVLQDGRLVGIVSEADLLHRYEIGTEEAREGSWWSRLLATDRSIETYIRSHARRVADIMTREVVTVTPEATLAEVAALFEARRVKRVPVVEAGQVVGMVSRADLVRALARATRPAAAAQAASDLEIRARLLHELERQPWWHSRTSQVMVQDGTVLFTGTIDAESERDAARIAAETVPGVRRVEDTRFLFRDLPSMV
jgi:CBS domain-containing protein